MSEQVDNTTVNPEVTEEAQAPAEPVYLDAATAQIHLMAGYDIMRVAWNGEKRLNRAAAAPPDFPNPFIQMLDKSGARMNWTEEEMQEDVAANDWIVVSQP